MNTRRHLLGALCLASAAFPLLAVSREPARSSSTTPVDSRSLPGTLRTNHERYMRLAINEAVKNPAYPFGAVVVHDASGEVRGRGVNMSIENSMYHGEVVAMNDYVAMYGNRGWQECTLYTTGEPCSMCTSAMVWAGIPRIVWGSSMSTIKASGINQIELSVAEVVDRSTSFYRPEALVAGVLAVETDRIFINRERDGR